MDSVKGILHKKAIVHDNVCILNKESVNFIYQDFLISFLQYIFNSQHAISYIRFAYENDKTDFNNCL